MDFFQFIWHVPEDGYEWRSGSFGAFPSTETREGPALLPVGETLRAYQPEPDLFLNFAAIDPNSDSEILSFANSYGLLGGGPRWIAPHRKGTKTPAVEGELRSHWREHLYRMKATVSLWQAIENNDTSVLARCIRWRSADHITFDWPPASERTTPWSTHATIASRSANSHLLKRFARGDVVAPARIYLQEEVNKSLGDYVHLRLLWLAPDRNRMGLFSVPTTLVGHLWLQLASAIVGVRKFRTCESCGKPMLVAPEGSGYRTNRRTCSNACRIRLYAGRKLQARELRKQKVPLQEIADRLKTNIKQVKRWIAER